MRLATLRSTVNLLAKILGLAGSIWGLVLTLVQAVYILPEQSTGAYGPWPTIRFGIVGLALYGASLVCVVAGYRGVLILILLVMIPLNVLALASVGVALVPGTALLIVAVVLFWVSGARR